MDSKDLWTCGSVKTYIQFYKNIGHLEFSRKHAAILDFVCILDLFKIYIFLLRVYHCTIYFVNSDDAYSAEETIN